MPFFSIIIPVYNASSTLQETLVSVKNQSFKDYEIVIVDDGSSDGSAQIIDQELEKNQVVQLLSQENKGLGNARNTAARMAVGTWLVFLDADDYWSPNKLQKVYNAISEVEPDLVYHGIYEKSATGRMRKRVFKPISSLSEFIKIGNPFVPSAMAIKKSVFLNIGGFIEDRNQVEDLLLWFRLLKAHVNVCAINAPLTVYRLGVGVTADLKDHLAKVELAIRKAQEEGIINADQVAIMMNVKHLEVARQLHKMADFRAAELQYAKVKRSGFKVYVLALLCKMHITI